MARLKIEGLGSFDGEYEFDDSRFTMRDFHTIKRIAGVRAGELSDALAAADTDLVVAIAAIALERNGKTGAEDALWGADAGQITLILGDDEEVDDGPPAVAAGPNPSSGGSSTQGSAPPVTPPSPTGDQPSDTSAISGQEISGI